MRILDFTSRNATKRTPDGQAKGLREPGPAGRRDGVVPTGDRTTLEPESKGAPSERGLPDLSWARDDSKGERRGEDKEAVGRARTAGETAGRSGREAEKGRTFAEQQHSKAQGDQSQRQDGHQALPAKKKAPLTRSAQKPRSLAGGGSQSPSTGTGGGRVSTNPGLMAGATSGSSAGSPWRGGTSNSHGTGETALNVEKNEEGRGRLEGAAEKQKQAQDSAREGARSHFEQGAQAGQTVQKQGQAQKSTQQAALENLKQGRELQKTSGLEAQASKQKTGMGQSEQNQALQQLKKLAQEKVKEVKGKLMEAKGKATQQAGKTTHQTGKTTETTGKTTETTGQTTEATGQAQVGTGQGLIAAGQALLASVFGAAAGAAMIAQGTAVQAAGQALQATGKTLQSTGKTLQSQGKGLQQKGKSLEQQGKQTEQKGKQEVKKAKQGQQKAKKAEQKHTRQAKQFFDESKKHQQASEKAREGSEKQFESAQDNQDRSTEHGTARGKALEHQQQARQFGSQEQGRAQRAEDNLSALNRALKEAFGEGGGGADRGGVQPSEGTQSQGEPTAPVAALGSAGGSYENPGRSSGQNAGRPGLGAAGQAKKLGQKGQGRNGLARFLGLGDRATKEREGRRANTERDRPESGRAVADQPTKDNGNVQALTTAQATAAPQAQQPQVEALGPKSRPVSLPHNGAETAPTVQPAGQDRNGVTPGMNLKASPRFGRQGASPTRVGGRAQALKAGAKRPGAQARTGGAVMGLGGNSTGAPSGVPTTGDSGAEQGRQAREVDGATTSGTAGQGNAKHEISDRRINVSLNDLAARS